MKIKITQILDINKSTDLFISKMMLKNRELKLKKKQ